ncbi:MAG: hypothetical protein J5819_04510 [Eubacterium sp.]|nr:hypothetical protein [Eubacterium sp.]
MPKHYSVLYTQVAKQDALKDLINKHLPKTRGSAFIPLMEYYRRSKKSIEYVAMFPGYVFVYSDLGIMELHRLLRDHREEIPGGVRELNLREKTALSPEAIYDYSEEELQQMNDLTPDEEQFLNVLWENGGLLLMSYGYQERGKYHVMEGPLRVYENRIKSVDKHNRKAFLDFEIQERAVRAGFECKPKSHWFPDENSQLMKLEDGSEVDLSELTKTMTSRLPSDKKDEKQSRNMRSYKTPGPKYTTKRTGK